MVGIPAEVDFSLTIGRALLGPRWDYHRISFGLIIQYLSPLFMLLSTILALLVIVGRVPADITYAITFLTLTAMTFNIPYLNIELCKLVLSQFQVWFLWAQACAAAVFWTMIARDVRAMLGFLLLFIIVVVTLFEAGPPAFRRRAVAGNLFCSLSLVAFAFVLLKDLVPHRHDRTLKLGPLEVSISQLLVDRMYVILIFLVKNTLSGLVQPHQFVLISANVRVGRRDLPPGASRGSSVGLMRHSLSSG